MTESWGSTPDPWATQQAAATDWPAQAPADASGWGGEAAPAATGPGYTPPTSAEMMGAPSVPSFSFDADPGTEHGGVIVDLPDAMHKRNYDTKELEYWPAQPGQAPRPKWTFPVICQTDHNDPSIQDDDGQRAHYLEYKKLDAVKKAVRAAGAEKLEVGGEVYIKLLGGGSKDRTSQYSGSKSKVYEARYRTAAQRGSSPVAAQATQPAPVDPWEGLNQAARAELVARGLQPGQVLPHIRHLDGWVNAPASAILTKVPRPAAGPPAQPAYDEPPF